MAYYQLNSDYGRHKPFVGKFVKFKKFPVWFPEGRWWEKKAIVIKSKYLLNAVLIQMSAQIYLASVLQRKELAPRNKLIEMSHYPEVNCRENGNRIPSRDYFTSESVCCRHSNGKLALKTIRTIWRVFCVFPKLTTNNPTKGLCQP